MVALAYLYHCCLTNDRTTFHMICLLIGYNCVVFTSIMALMKTEQVGIGNSIRNLCKPHFNLINKKETQTCVNWLIRYIIQDVGLKYL